MKYVRILLVLLSIAPVFLLFQNFTPAQPKAIIQSSSAIPSLNLYISTKGSDRNAGTSPGQPLATLAQAQVVVAKFLQKTNQTGYVHIGIAPGNYFNESITWIAIPKKGWLNIIGNYNKRPVFDGRKNVKSKLGSQPSLLTFKPAFLGPVNIRVSNLMVQYYVEGISFISNRDLIDGGISGVLVSRIGFSKIGNSYASFKEKNGEFKRGLAVIRLVNTRHSRFSGNDFHNINNGGGGNLQHAFYVAHFSSNNIFEGNSFIDNGSGTAIKIRDYSNENIIQANYFERVSPAALELWHCERADRNDCTKKLPGETYSFDNREVKNLYIGGRTAKEYRGRGTANPLPFPGGSPEFIFDSVIRSGFQVRTYRTDNLSYYGICSRPNDCVNANNRCFQEGTGSPNLLCANNSWVNCGDSNIGQNLAGQKCIRLGKKTEWRYKVIKPAPKPIPKPTTPYNWFDSSNQY